VIDASAGLEWLLQTPTGLRVDAFILRQTDTRHHVPQLFFLEVTQVVRRWWISGIVTLSRAEQCMEDLKAVNLTSHPHLIHIDRIWQLRENLSAYDAAYVALAESLGATLLTCDRRLASAPHGARTELILPAKTN
jgi:predicted nucleic acid-binding protein